MPDFLVGMEGEQSSHILLVEKRDQRLRLYKCQNANCQVVKSYRCSTGQKEGDKRRVGDRRTPEGVYFLVDFKRDKDLAPEYGAGAFPLDYPNPIDRGKGKDGNGIWLHGTNKVNLPSTDTKGCVVVSNNDLLDLSRYIRLRETPTVIKDKYRCGQVQVLLKSPDSGPTETRSARPRLSYFILELNGIRRAVTDEEDLEVVRGDKLRIVDALLDPGGRDGIKVNIVGYVGDKKGANRGEDRGYLIDTATDLMPRYSVDRKGNRYVVEVKLRDHLCGRMFIRLWEAGK
ncbi:MAG: L,D-transpeptidase family protein [Nitrospinae bacterium]|nr:L,D-transpeptidase family protein [Nitrospinota bacterium]